jgi:hypothetical protein
MNRDIYAIAALTVAALAAAVVLTALHDDSEKAWALVALLAGGLLARWEKTPS